MKVYIEILLVLFLIFGLMTTTFYIIEFGLSRQIIFYIWDDLIVAAFIAFVLTTWHIFSVKRLPFQNIKDALNFTHSRRIEIEMSYDAIIKLCIASLETVTNSRIREVSYTDGRVVAMVPADWKTLGQVISFDITELAAQRYAIAIVSKPAFPALRVDFGKNLENIEKVSEFLLQKSKSNS